MALASTLPAFAVLPQLGDSARSTPGDAAGERGQRYGSHNEMERETGEMMRGWQIQHFYGCAIHVLVVPGTKGRLGYSYTGFVCTRENDVMMYPRLERFHNPSADFDSADAAMTAALGQGKTIAARLLAVARDENVPCFTASMLLAPPVPRKEQP
ncbi:hypothetical protein [Ralstonia sp. 1138]|uniref:hypothetical protein n=1 Tax=Ralstonia sp. 1138 TaxID=3156423 RepID=UPI0033983051